MLAILRTRPVFSSLRVSTRLITRNLPPQYFDISDVNSSPRFRFLESRVLMISASLLIFTSSPGCRRSVEVGVLVRLPCLWKITFDPRDFRTAFEVERSNTLRRSDGLKAPDFTSQMYCLISQKGSRELAFFKPLA